MQDLTLRQMIREWWRAQIKGKEDVNVKELAEVGAEQLRQDPTFRERYLEETIRPLVYDVGLSVIQQNRRVHHGENRDADDETRRVNATEVARIIEEESRWARWLEHDPISGKHIQIFKLTKEQALAAAKARRERATPDLRAAGLLELAAGRLRSGQAIGDVWTDESLTQLEERILVGRPKVTLGPVGAKTVLGMILEEDHAGAK